MPFAVVLDTCVLYPAHLRDTLLRLAERGLYQALWSADILTELHRNLVEVGIRSDTVDYLHAEMQGAFPEAEVTGYHTAMHSMTCDPKDRHVLAAAVRSDAAAIVTFNVADFPAPSVNPYKIDVVHPADFLLDLLDLAPSIVITELNSQATANRRAPKTLNGLLEALSRAGVPSFTDQARRQTE